VTNFRHFAKNKILMNILSLISLFLIIAKKRNLLKIRQKSWQLPPQGYNMKECLRFFYYNILNIAKFTLMFSLMIATCEKKKKKKSHYFLFFFFYFI